MPCGASTFGVEADQGSGGARHSALKKRSAGDLVTVGVIANPSSGRDIRRFVSAASVFDNAEKGNMVHRLMAGLGAVGVDRVLMMPAGSGLGETLRRRLQARSGPAQELPTLELVEMTVKETAEDTVQAVRRMIEVGVQAIVVLGGDGTHRVVAKHCGDIPLCALSTGTNNAFPEMREATVAGLATGLVARGLVDGVELRRHKVLHVDVNQGEKKELAIVDVAVSRQRFIGARALWRVADTSELFVTFGTPGAMGLSSIAGLLEPTARSAPHGVHVRLSDPATAEHVVMVPVAPGLLVEIGVGFVRRIAFGEEVSIPRGSGSIALDGEREIEFGPEDSTVVRLEARGPNTVNVESVMMAAAELGLLRKKSFAGG